MYHVYINNRIKLSASECTGIQIFETFFVIQFTKELEKKTGNRDTRWLPPQNLPSFIT
jgi:hypothetical protein